MNTTGKTVLIIGGSAGIGFEIARAFSDNGSKVIITGRNEEKLKAAAASLSGAAWFAGDISREKDLDSLVAFITANYPSLDILVNNAAKAAVYSIGPDENTAANAAGEMATNYLSVVSLTEKLTPLLAARREAAIVNVTSILALTPSVRMPTHSASKAALRAYTQILRFTLEMQGSAIKVFELMPPLTNTEFSKPIGGEKGIPAADVAQALLEGMRNDTAEIRVAQADGFYKAFFAESGKALAALHQR